MPVVARQDDKAKKYDNADKLIRQAVQIKPDASILCLELVTAQHRPKEEDTGATLLKHALDMDAASQKTQS